MSNPDFKALADEALVTLTEIADTAAGKLAGDGLSYANSFATGNTLTSVQASQNLENISQVNRDAWAALKREPSIARIVLEDDEGEQRIVYIARKTSLPLASETEFASYGSPIGRLAEIPVGDVANIVVRGKRQTYYLVERTNLTPEMFEGEWDSTDNQYRHADFGVFSIDSLRAFLRAEGIDAGDELDQLLEMVAATNGVKEGISHQTRTAMGLRDQPILDQFQGEIFRLPIDSQLIILGPPGTGKTTTLIKRLGQKLDVENLDEHERRLIAADPGHSIPHENSWLMFTPSELLKHYLKEAFNREQVPASDARIKTWTAYRNDIARNSLGILRTSNGGKYTLKLDMLNLASAVLTDTREWYAALSNFHNLRLKIQLKDGALIVKEAAPATATIVVEQLLRLSEGLDGRAWTDIYRDLGKQEPLFKVTLDESKRIADDLLKQERNRIFNSDKEVFQRLAQYLTGVQQDDEPDEEAEFDEDETESIGNPNTGDIQNAVRAYLAALRTLARSRYRKRSVPKGSRAFRVVLWLGDALPSDAVLLEIGQRISFQNGLRRFVGAFRRYVSDVPTSYRLFRKEQSETAKFFVEVASNPLHLSPTELDAIVLLMLRNCRTLLSQSFIERELDAPRYESLRNIASLFKNQIMVDEATDFSMLQLACMESLTTLRSSSFFACGDFNQRITHSGVRTMDQIAWVSARISARFVTQIYRQSRELNAFAGELLRLQDGDLTAIGKLPKDSTHEGVKPVLLESANEDQAAKWISDRIAEVERAVRQMPTIAVLVNAEEDVRPMAERLTGYLESINLKAVACEEGKALGEGADVRVFDIQHIKGLEFEAVFFAGVDRLAEQKPDLFDRYLYVGATRAATYLGLVCYQEIPNKLRPLLPEFVGDWAA